MKKSVLIVIAAVVAIFISGCSGLSQQHKVEMGDYDVRFSASGSAEVVTKTPASYLLQEDDFSLNITSIQDDAHESFDSWKTEIENTLFQDGGRMLIEQDAVSDTEYFLKYKDSNGFYQSMTLLWFDEEPDPQRFIIGLTTLDEDNENVNKILDSLEVAPN